MIFQKNSILALIEQRRVTKRWITGGEFMLTNPAQIRKFLEGLDYPAKKQNLIEHAKKNMSATRYCRI